MSKNQALIAVFDSHSKAEEAIKELDRSGFDMKKLSIVGKGYHSEEHPVGFTRGATGSWPGAALALSGAGSGVCSRAPHSSGSRASDRWRREG